MALSKKEVDAIVTRYDRGRGDSIEALASAYEVGAEVVRFHLKQRAVLTDKPHTEESDAELGIGEETHADSAAQLAALMANPALKSLIDAAVEARLKELGAASATPVESRGKAPELEAFLASVKHMLDVNAMQQPGYVKPLPAEEIDRRAAGFIEMESLLDKARSDGIAPHYLLGDKFYAGDILYEEGQQIRTYLPPAEHFRPLNETASRVYSAMMVWIGGRTKDIGEQVAEAMAAAKAQPPLVGGAYDAPRRGGPVEVVDAPRADVKPKRVAGTIVAETHGAPGPKQPGITEAPMGPVFVGD